MTLSLYPGTAAPYSPGGGRRPRLLELREVCGRRREARVPQGYPADALRDGGSCGHGPEGEGEGQGKALGR